MRHPVRLAVISSYPPQADGFAEDAAELTRTLVTDHDVAVCAVGRRGLAYPDEVLTVVAADDPADYRRAAGVLIDHGIDTALIRYEDGVYGGVAGSHVLDLAAELRRHGVAVVVSLPSGRRDLGAHLEPYCRGPDRRRPVRAGADGGRRASSPWPGAWPPRTSCGSCRSVSRPPCCALAGDPPPPVEPRRADVADVVGRTRPRAPVIAVARRPMSPPRFRGRAGRPAGTAPRSRTSSRPAGVSRSPRTSRGCGSSLRDPCSADQAALLARTARSISRSATTRWWRGPGSRPARLAVPATARVDPAALRAALSTALPGVQTLLCARRRQLGRVARHCFARRGEPVLGEPGTGSAAVVPPGGSHRLARTALGRLRSFQPDRDARLATVAAGLLGLPPDAVSPVAWSVARSLGRSGRTGARGDGAGRPRARRRQSGGVGSGRDRGRPGGAGFACATRPACCARCCWRPSRPISPAPPTSCSAWPATRYWARSRVRPWPARRTGCGPPGAAAAAAWPCFAERLRPGDIRLAHALVVAGDRLGDDALVALGVESVDWMARRAGLGTADGTLAPLVPVATEAGAYVEALAGRTGSRARSGTPGWRSARWPGSTGRTRRPRRSTTPRSARVEAGPGTRRRDVDRQRRGDAGLPGGRPRGAGRRVADLPAAELARQDLAAIA